MNVRSGIALASCLSLLCFVAAPAAATSTTTYDPFYGTADGEVDFYDIDETSTTDDTPLFGQPVRIGNTLLFYPTAFVSESADGDPDTTQGKLRMRISTYPGTFIERIIVSEYGDYLLTGPGTDATQANVGGSLQIMDLTPGHFPTIIQVPLESVPAAPYALPGDSGDIFLASAQITDLLQYEWTDIYLIFTDTLQTTSEAGTVSFIQKNMIQGPVALTVIPEPGCLSLLVVGLVAMKRRRA